MCQRFAAARWAWPRLGGSPARRRVRSRAGHGLGLVRHQDPLSGEVYGFLTNEPDLPPGGVAELYRRRREAEKVFDPNKHQLEQQKAWGTALAAKATQARLIAITHHLLLDDEQKLERRHALVPVAQDRRRPAVGRHPPDRREPWVANASLGHARTTGRAAQRQVHPHGGAMRCGKSSRQRHPVCSDPMARHENGDSTPMGDWFDPSAQSSCNHTKPN